MDSQNQDFLTEREIIILRTLVHDFIEEGKPIGSRYLTNKYKFNLSSATIRNVMSDLEQRGFISQPHSSAGRVPTDKGYRLYFNEIIKLYNDALNERRKLEDLFQLKQLEIDSILKHSSRLLSGLSNMTSIVIGPRSDELVIKKVEILNLGEGEILIILITRSKMVINRRVQFKQNIGNDELDIISRFLNETVIGYSIHEVKDVLYNKIQEIKDDLGGLRNKALLLAENITGSGIGYTSSEIYIEGMRHILSNNHDFNQRDLSDIVSVIEQKEPLRSILSHHINEDGIHALIGNEIQIEEIAGCSIITSNYKMANKNIGMLGIIGPTRMQYDKMVPLVDHLSKSITQLLNKLSE